MATNTVSISQSVCNSQIFDPFRDSLTEGYFSDAVIDHHGCTFNRPFILQWLSEHHTCPYTQLPLQAYQLISNRAFQQAQDQLFNEENGSVVMLQRQVTVLTQENSELKAENQQLKADKKDRDDKIEFLFAEFQQMNVTMKTLVADNKSLTKEVQELRKSVENKSNNKVSVVTEKALKEIGSSSNSCIGSTSECIVATAKAFTYPVVFPVKKIAKLIF